MKFRLFFWSILPVNEHSNLRKNMGSKTWQKHTFECYFMGGISHQNQVEISWKIADSGMLLLFKNVVLRKNHMLESEFFHEISTWFSWESLPIKEHSKLCFWNVFESMFVLRFECSFTGRIIQKKQVNISWKFPDSSIWLFVKKRRFSNIRLSEIHTVGIKNIIISYFFGL